MKKILLLLAVSALLVSPTARAQDAATEERLNKLAGQIEDLQAARVKLDKQMADLLKELSSLREQMAKPTGDFVSRDELRKLAGQLQDIDEKRVADNEKILKEIEKLGRAGATTGGKKPRQATAPRPDTTTSGAGADKGYEYIIQSGDSLSIIAQAYREKGVKIYSDDILKANPGLKEKSLQPGQKIFIPAAPQ